jgi:ABC-type uncharacterized transport system involved in gliding motility auxiliary subunit
MLIMQDPFSEADLNTLLLNWRVRFEDGVAIDQIRFVENPTNPATDSYQYSTITKDMNGLIALFPLARGISQVGDATSTDIVYTPLVETSSQSWSETDQETVALDAADIPGPLTLAATVESQPMLAAGSEDGTKTRIVLIGDADFASNAAADIPGNGVLFLNAVNWLAEEESLIAIGPKDARGQPPSYDNVASSLIWFGSICGIPGIVLATGITVWVVRRLSPKIVIQPTVEEGDEYDEYDEYEEDEEYDEYEEDEL